MVCLSRTSEMESSDMENSEMTELRRGHNTKGL